MAAEVPGAAAAGTGILDGGAAVDGNGPPADPGGIAGRILETAARLRAVRPAAVPVAFWDLDGTLLEGDCVDGFRRSDGEGYAGLVERAIAGGLCPAYPDAGGYARCERDFGALKQAEGRAVAYGFQSRIFAGASEAVLKEHARRAFTEDLGPWFFAEALGWWRRLEEAGVRCWVLSASPDFFVKGAAEALGVPEERCTGMRLEPGSPGILGSAILGPLMFGAGKVQRMNELLARMVAAEPDRAFYPVAAFGNDVASDGPMLEAVRRSRLPAGEPLGVFVNLSSPAPADHVPAPLILRPRAARL